MYLQSHVICQVIGHVRAGEWPGATTPSATMSANTGTCICICRPQYLFTSARAVVCVDHNICLRRPTLGPALATSPVYICRPQYLLTSARAVTCIGHNMCLRRPQHLFTSANTGTCVGHIIVPATGRWHSRIPRVLGIQPARHSVPVPGMEAVGTV